VRGPAWALWKKFHRFGGLGASFSALVFFEDFNQLPSLISAAASLIEFLRTFPAIRLVEPDGTLGPWAVCKARDVRFEAMAGRNDLFVSSSLSEGLRSPRVIFFMGDPLRTLSGIADGNSVGRFFSNTDCDELLIVLFSSNP